MSVAMIYRFATRLLAFASLLALAVGVLRGPAAAEDRVEMRFEGFGVAGLHVVTTHTAIEETSAAYVIETQFQTAGAAGIFLTVFGQSWVRGQLAEGKPRPEAFQSDVRRNGVDRRLQVDYRADGTVIGSATPPATEPVTPVPADQLRGTVDSVTAFYQLERQLARGGGCALKIPVFDGRHRYDLQFSDAGRPILTPAANQNFAGLTQACRMARQEIGGFFVDRSHIEGVRAGTIWYARLVPGDSLIPVRIDMQSEIGDVAIYLSELRGRGVDLQFME